MVSHTRRSTKGTRSKGRKGRTTSKGRKGSKGKKANKSKKRGGGKVGTHGHGEWHPPKHHPKHHGETGHGSILGHLGHHM
jgi:hypothetical protein